VTGVGLGVFMVVLVGAVVGILLCRLIELFTTGRHGRSPNALIFLRPCRTVRSNPYRAWGRPLKGRLPHRRLCPEQLRYPATSRIWTIDKH
jgi:hypothetical protein